MITLIKSYKYDNKYDFIKTFTTKEQQTSYFNSLDKIYIDDDSYIKQHNSFNVDMNFEDMTEQGINYVIFNNGYRNIYAFIIEKIYLNEETTQINFDIDVLQTYMFDFTIQNSFIERKVCTLDEISDYDEGLNIGEHLVEYNSILFNKDYTYFAMFNNFRQSQVVVEDDVVKGVYDMPYPSGDAITFIDGIPYPCHYMPLKDGFIPQFLSDHPSLIGITRFPQCNYTTTEISIPCLSKLTPADPNKKPYWQNITYKVDMASTITSQGELSSSRGITKSKVTDFYPYTYYVLTDGECEPLVMQPQYMNGSVTVTRKTALSHQPVERYTADYKGDTTGVLYNITNSSQMMLPTGNNEGMAYLNANVNATAYNRKNQVVNTGVQALQTIGGAVATGGMSLLLGGVSNTVNSLTNIRQTDARNKDILETPSSITSFGTPSTRNSFGTNCVRLVKYTVTDKVKNKVENFCKRYGNKFNNYDVIDIKGYKGYIKYISPNLDGKIDNIHLNKISEILERGAYIE